MKDSKFSNAKNNVLVDVILPNYNKDNFLEEAINSLINQTYKNFHIYIIDDNSTDKSWDVIKSFKNLDKITSIKLKKNMGPSFCRNYGMRISDSKYISFIDSDDIWEINKLEKQINFMERDNLKFTYTDYVPFFQDGDKKNFKKKNPLKK